MKENKKNLVFNIFNRKEDEEEFNLGQEKDEDTHKNKQKELHLKFESMFSSRTVKKVKKSPSREKDNLFNKMMEQLTNQPVIESKPLDYPLSINYILIIKD
jgi:hypothetical protein